METASKYNFTYPTYTMFVQNVCGEFSKSWSNLEWKHKTPSGWLDIIKRYGSVTQQDIIYVLLCAVLWTVLRSILTALIFKPIVSRSGLGKQESVKAPESAWKLIFYSCTWVYSIYLLFFTENNFFHDAPSTFYDWKPQSVVATKIYIAYLVQSSFYLHSVHATLFVDVWRKDSVVMLAHHFVTMLLIGFSYVFRYTNVGVLILFLHDITDILLEGTKLTVYYKTKGGMWNTICDFLSTVGFIMFGMAWFVFRLYWYPLKAMYAAGYVSKVVSNELVFYHFFNGLLWILLGMNVYWFKFIVVMAYKVLTGKTKEVEDIREDEKKEVGKENKKME